MNMYVQYLEHLFSSKLELSTNNFTFCYSDSLDRLSTYSKHVHKGWVRTRMLTSIHQQIYLIWSSYWVKTNETKHEWVKWQYNVDSVIVTQYNNRHKTASIVQDCTRLAIWQKQLWMINHQSLILTEVILPKQGMFYSIRSSYLYHNSKQFRLQ